MADRVDTKRPSQAPAKSPAGKSPLGAKAAAEPPAAPGKPGGPMPGLQWKSLAYVGGALAILWLIALAAGSKIVFGLVVAVTLAVVAALAYAWNWARKQRKMLELLQGAAASPEARKEALAKLQAESGADKDVMNAFARAQLEAQDDPDKALATLESIDLQKTPGPMQDQVRAMRAQLYLLLGRPREARVLADDIKVSAVQEPEARGMLAAVVAESWARTGKQDQAVDLLNTVKPEDPDYGQARVPLLFARVYAAFATGNRDQVRKDLNALMRQDMNLLGRFVMPKAKVHPELQKIARDVLSKNPEVRKLAQRQQRGGGGGGGRRMR